MTDTRSTADVTVVPANEASWDDLVAIFGTADYPGRCQCQRFKVAGWIWRDSTQEQRTAMLRGQTACGDRDAATSGLVAYVDGEPAGWVAVEPRTAYPKLRGSRVPWTGRSEDKDDTGVWAVTCFAVRKGYRGRGLTYPLAEATIGFARERGARALEAYPMITRPGKESPGASCTSVPVRCSPTPGSPKSATRHRAAWSCVLSCPLWTDTHHPHVRSGTTRMRTEYSASKASGVWNPMAAYAGPYLSR
ncbi:GNAT family N-acetyltransferase [Amycolatopsis sp. NPDC101161]|uniref:GNAT family N-acetyltransferase n=1 Tax=Amycolatopsis sp. NPDC101161 TaxID=3363940 RepID=UPI00382BE759